MKDGKEDGVGSRVYADGCILEAVWVDGKRTGKGCCTWPNGLKLELEYHDDKVIGTAKGHGECYLEDGSRYQGGIMEKLLPPGYKQVWHLHKWLQNNCSIQWHACSSFSSALWHDRLALHLRFHIHGVAHPCRIPLLRLSAPRPSLCEIVSVMMSFLARNLTQHTMPLL